MIKKAPFPRRIPGFRDLGKPPILMILLSMDLTDNPGYSEN